MVSERRVSFVLIVAALALGLGIGLLGELATLKERVTRIAERETITCPEDSVIVGYGQYHEGHWSGYECIPRGEVE